MNVTIKWPRFLIVTIVGAIVMLVLYGLWTGKVVAPMNLAPGMPSRPPEETKPLLPFLAVVSITQLVVFCYLYLRVYPQRTLGNAIWWGFWGGFVMVLPDGQFLVGTPNQTWGNMLMGWADGMVTAMLMMAFFQLLYRPKNESRTPVKLDLPRFLICGALGTILIFVIDIAFHAYFAKLLFTDYPPADFPQRPASETGALMPWLFAVYLVQLTFFCYLFLRIYPRRGMGSALWFGVWLALWVAIPNMQFFVGLDKYTWKMLAIQIPEGVIITMLLMAFFEWAYRPKAHAALAAAE